jgi:ribonuclease HI
MYLLTDGSADPKSGIGFGVYLAFSELSEDLSSLKGLIKVKQFDNTSSTKLELQTLLWALSEISDKKVVSYTDSQNIVGLLSRKEKLVKNNYYSKNGKLLKNHELYKDFFESIEKFEIKFNFINGHKPSSNKDHLDKIFSLVDRASRNALRNYIKNNVSIFLFGCIFLRFLI